MPRKNRNISDNALLEFTRQLVRIVPSIETLEEELKRLSSAIKPSEFTRGDYNQVLFSLERIYYITLLMKELQEHFSSRIQFGGGVVLNYIFMPQLDVPRFTFDLDSSWRERVSSKRSILGEIVGFNKYLSEKYPICLPVSADKCLKLMTVEYDVEKDHFPHVLSLRLPVITRWSGVEFYNYVKVSTGLELDYTALSKLRKCFQSSIGVKDARVDYVRFEITLEPGYPSRELEVDLPFKLGRVKLNITELEYQLASKLVFKIGWNFGADLQANLHDVLKAILDMRLLVLVDEFRFKNYVELLASSRGLRLRDIGDNIERNTSELLKTGGELWSGFHYLLIRAKYRDLLKLIQGTVRRLYNLLF